jgi:hypothetical protein
MLRIGKKPTRPVILGKLPVKQVKLGPKAQPLIRRKPIAQY